MPMFELITVLLPHYNHENYLMDAVQSILDQTYDNFELFILNDSERSVKKYELIDSRITVFDRIDGEKHSSEYRINNIITFTNGVYLAYQEADGYSLPYRLEATYKFLYQEKADPNEP